jgi:hypothetical protein
MEPLQIRSPTMIAVGVAKPKAHVHVTTRMATVGIKAAAATP